MDPHFRSITGLPHCGQRWVIHSQLVMAKRVLFLFLNAHQSKRSGSYVGGCRTMLNSMRCVLVKQYFSHSSCQLAGKWLSSFLGLCLQETDNSCPAAFQFSETYLLNLYSLAWLSVWQLCVRLRTGTSLRHYQSSSAVLRWGAGMLTDE